ncbi:MAG: amidohydrolase family protein [Pirellulaceae bacterium]|nr:amidohydrolase family protein [Pirellulaceae bacterium]
MSQTALNFVFDKQPGPSDPADQKLVLKRMNVRRALYRLSVGILLIGLVTPLPAQTIAYTNATIETLGEAGRIENGTIIVRAGKIVAVGANVEIPGEARVVSLQGKTVVPGFVDPYLIYKRTPQTSEESETVSFGGRTFQIPRAASFNPGSFDNIRQSFYPQSFDFSRHIRVGVTTANLVSDSRGLSALAGMQTDPQPNMLIDDHGWLFLRLTNETTALDQLRNALTPPRAPGPPASAGTTASAGTPTGGPPRGAPGQTTGQAAAGTPPQAAPADPNAARWADVREGKQPIIVNANNAATVAHLLRLLAKHSKVRVLLVSTGPNVYESLDQIKGTNVSLILKPEIATQPYSERRINVPQMAAERKIPFAFSLTVGSSQLDATQDDPLFPLAALVKTGLDRQQALAALAATPAKMLGIEEKFGTIEAGKAANFVVFSGDPLASGNRLEHVIVKGVSIHGN